MDRTQILHRLQQVAVGRVPIDPRLLLPEAKLADIGLDSFSLIELLFLAEEEFSIRIPLDGLRLHTVGEIVEVIANQIGVHFSTRAGNG